MDDKIKLKQEQEELEVTWTYLSGCKTNWLKFENPNVVMWLQAELKTMREAAVWRRSQDEFHNVEGFFILIFILIFIIDCDDLVFFWEKVLYWFVTMKLPWVSL